MLATKVSAMNAIKVHRYQTQDITFEDTELLGKVHQAGRELSGKSDKFSAGMRAQAEQDVVNFANTRERLQLDMSGWKFTDAYHQADAAGHQMYNTFSDNVTRQLGNITQQYSLGQITSQEALRQINNVAAYSQNQLLTVVNDGLNVIRDYAKSHPQFDLHAYEDAMSYIVSHPNAIVEMNQAMVDTVEIGEMLQGLTATQQHIIATLPSDLTTTLICAASSACLAKNVASDMNKKYAKKVTYRNEITDMMDRYMRGVDEYDAPEDKKTSKK